MPPLVTQRPTKSGPFLLPARVLLPLFGLIAVATGALHLADELHRAEVDRLYAAIAGAVWIIFAAGVVGAFWGRRPALLAAGIPAFVAFGLQTSTHFVPGTNSISDLTHTQGQSFAIAVLALVCSCVMVAILSVIAWSNPAGRSRRVATAPLLGVAVLGSILLLLHAADDILVSGFGTLKPEDGALVAMVTAVAWTGGALWIASAQVRGSILTAAASANVVIPFVTIHLASGGVSVAKIAATEGVPWAVIAVALFVCAALSLVASVGLLVLALVQRRRRRALLKKTPPALRRRTTI
jgi:hypothetical protein